MYLPKTVGGWSGIGIRTLYVWLGRILAAGPEFEPLFAHRCQLNKYIPIKRGWKPAAHAGHQLLLYLYTSSGSFGVLGAGFGILMPHLQLFGLAGV